MYLSCVASVGYALGPAILGLFEILVNSLQLQGLVVDPDSAPGWCMAILHLVFMVKIVLMFQDGSSEVARRGPLDKARDVGADGLAVGACCAAFWHLATASAVLAVTEVFAVHLAQQLWGWSIGGSAFLLAA